MIPLIRVKGDLCDREAGASASQIRWPMHADQFMNDNPSRPAWSASMTGHEVLRAGLRWVFLFEWE